MKWGLHGATEVIQSQFTAQYIDHIDERPAAHSTCGLALIDTSEGLKQSDGLPTVGFLAEETGKCGVITSEGERLSAEPFADEVDLQIGACVGDGQDAADGVEGKGIGHGEALMMQRSRSGP